MADHPSVSGATPDPTSPMQGRLGRFELRRSLPESAAAQLWVARDPRTGREVRLKWMKLAQGVPPETAVQWAREARSRNHLVHPSIAPVLDVDVVEGRPLLISQWLSGPTMAAVLHDRRRLTATAAVDWMVQVLDALVVAHAAGIVHGGIKAQNMLIDSLDRARIMDFAVPTRLRGQSANVHAMNAGTDMQDAGRLFADMVFGTGWASGHGGGGVPADTATHMLAAALDAGMDDGLRDILAHALADDAALRHPSARAFADRLLEWRAKPGGPAKAREPEKHSSERALSALMQRMQDDSDFPAMSHSVSRILGLASSDTESVATVATEILKDVGLANKLLRMVNSAYYARGGGVGTVSRAVSLVGFNAIRNMALGLVLLENMANQAHADVLTLEFLRALMAGSIARELSPLAADGEEVFIGATFQDLGRLIAKFYFLKESQQIQALVDVDRAPMTESSAAIRILGIDFEALGLAVATQWDLPQDIRKYLHKPVGEPPLRAATDAQLRLRWITVAANRIASTLLQWPHDRQPEHLGPVYKQYARVVGISAEAMQSATGLARQRLSELAAAVQLPIAHGSVADRLLVKAVQAAEAGHDESLLASLELPQHGDGHAAGAVLSPDEVLSAGIAAITQAMVDDRKPSDIVRMVLETMIHAKGFQRVVFCMRDPKGDALSGRFGLGEGVDTILSGFHVALGSGTSDLFQMVCIRGADTLIADATVDRVAQRLPDWYVKLINAPAFLLLPLVIGSKPLGLIYADMAHKNSLDFKEKELAQLRTLRNQIVMAFRHTHG